MQTKHRTSLAEKSPSFRNAYGSISTVSSADLPVLERLSLRRLLLSPQGIRAPHWHANAHELGYCLRGEHVVTIVESHNQRHSFTIAAGEMFFVPSGSLHHIENTGAAEGEMILAFSHEAVEDFGLTGVLRAFTPAVIGNSVGVEARALDGCDLAAADESILARVGAAEITEHERRADPLKFSVEQVAAQVASAAGSAHLAEIPAWPVLDKLSMFSLRITAQGMREIHWHPGTAEMGYVAAGQGRMSIVDPDGSVDTYAMSTGDMYFIPRAYPHHIENTGTDDLHILIFFDQNTPADVGALPVVSGLSRGVLAASFGTTAARLPQFEFVETDPLLVPRINPVDPAVDPAV